MSVKSEIIIEADHVHLQCTGSCNGAAEAKEVFQLALDLARVNRLRNVLIDAHQVQGCLSTLDRYEVACFLSELILGGAAEPPAIAVVGQEPLIDPERFGETVAQNRGVNAQAFTRREEAIVWLQSQLRCDP